jgi:hypothetical protein
VSANLISMMCAGEQFTMIPAKRLTALHQVARRVAGLSGALVECGVWNGGSAAVLADAARQPGRHVWLFDSWAGLPEPGTRDGERARTEWARHGGQFNVGDVGKPPEAFRVAGLSDCVLHLRRGWFRDTLPAATAEIGGVAILHIDADWYDSVKLCLKALYPLVVKGGLVILDDYGHWPGCRAAVDEFFVKSPVKLCAVDYTCRYFFKDE